MRVLLIGGGAISSHICKPEKKFVHAVVRVVSLRDFDLMDRNEKSEVLDSDYDRIFYLGYYRSNLSKNLSLLTFVMKKLKEQNFQGQLILASTQVTVLRNLCGRLSFWQRLFSLSTYFYIKKIQEMIVGSSKLRASILHLPIVIGLNDQRDDFFRSLGELAWSEFPNEGLNTLYFLSAIKLKQFILDKDMCGSFKDTKKHIFLYSETSTLKDYLTSNFPQSVDAKSINIPNRYSKFRLNKFVVIKFFRELALFTFHICLQGAKFKKQIEHSNKPQKNKPKKLIIIPISYFIQYSLEMSEPNEIRLSQNFSFRLI